MYELVIDPEFKHFCVTEDELKQARIRCERIIAAIQKLRDAVMPMVLRHVNMGPMLPKIMVPQSDGHVELMDPIDPTKPADWVTTWIDCIRELKSLTPPFSTAVLKAVESANVVYRVFAIQETATRDRLTARKQPTMHSSVAELAERYISKLDIPNLGTPMKMLILGDERFRIGRTVLMDIGAKVESATAKIAKEYERTRKWLVDPGWSVAGHGTEDAERSVDSAMTNGTEKAEVLPEDCTRPVTTNRLAQECLTDTSSVSEDDGTSPCSNGADNVTATDSTDELTSFVYRKDILRVEVDPIRWARNKVE